MLHPLRLCALALAFSLAACNQAPPPAEPGEALSAGATTVGQRDHNAFSLPSANLAPSRRLDFAVGNSFFRNPWVIAPTTTIARDGLGPLFNTNACQNCHIKDGRGHPPAANASSAASMLVRLSIPADGSSAHRELLQRNGVVPEPVYGGQLQDMSNPGVAPEGKVRVSYSSVPVTFADGTRVELRQPQLQISNLGYGPMHPDALFSARIAPPMIGLGLLEAIPESALLAHADPDDRDGDGIRGVANRVWDDARGTTVLGRFGWKAGQPSLNQQNAHAFANDMGLTSSLLPQDNCSAAQTDCRSAVNGGAPEVSDTIMASVLFYTRNLAVPARRAVNDLAVRQGKQLFNQAGCQKCHVPSFTTATDAAEPELANQTIRPYSDLLLHDMGDGLADGRSEFQASGRQWRTAPLWGIGLTDTVNGHTQFLHDGRARNLLEAILWHGGEAEAAKQQVLTYDAEQRSTLLAFLNSL
ncbi:di-heme oxidoreductase family protein [Aquipseudomonas ullengensis]|uniref:C-type cytochrome n=1 Tax=Aquipseudomonas ullengensis TaxID=2759166 RepID=A0A7W4LLX2_9GAMM|nr:di-heme oxidoredictase family protein [Pseudomonas ullengensis]MBB2495579.1 c-type cytochrome [Pseudomonas ullengensis]